MTEATRGCTIADCERPHQARGLCQSHYSKAARLRAKGDAELPPRESGRVRRRPLTCEQCGETRSVSPANLRFCSMSCRDNWRAEAGVNPHPPPKSDIQRAFLASDWLALRVALEAKSTKVPTGCWLWWPERPASYGAVRFGGKRHQAHRLMMYAIRSGDLDARTPVHHKCAVAACVNPSHLQTVTPQENTAEMFERHFYKQRIAALEAALAEAAPSHPLLSA